MTHRKATTYCSTDCYRISITDHGPELPPKPVKRAAPKTSRIFVTDCAVCARTFVSRYTISTCSPICTEVHRRDRNRDWAHRRRALERGAFVAPVSRIRIFERDRWTCQLCGFPLRRDVEPAHPEYPSLDHVVPLAKGGTHEPSNVQAAHMLCNSIKGAVLI